MSNSSGWMSSLRAPSKLQEQDRLATRAASSFADGLRARLEGVGREFERPTAANDAEFSGSISFWPEWLAGWDFADALLAKGWSFQTPPGQVHVDEARLQKAMRAQVAIGRGLGVPSE